MNNLLHNKLVNRILRYCGITLGCALFALGFELFLYPNSIITGGATGLSMIINALTGLPVGVMTIILNIPLFIIAWRHFGADFLISSAFGMALSSVFVDAFSLLGIAATNDAMLAAIIGGVIKGAGLGLVYNMGATTGGSDIVAKLMRKRFASVNFGTLMLIIDAVIVIAYAFILHTYESAMYAVITMFASSKVVDLALYGIDSFCVCNIISVKSDEISREIMNGVMHRGVTILDARGAYSGEKKNVMMCVIRKHQITELKRLVKQLDPNAFVIISDAKNVFGRGFDNIFEVK